VFQTEEERSKLELRMDSHGRDFVAVVIDFDGPDGVIIVDEVWMTAGEDKTEGGKRLYLTSDARVFGDGEPHVYYIHQA
jgi:hypothetical protein